LIFFKILKIYIYFYFSFIFSKFFEKENSDNESNIRLIDKFIPSFKLAKFLVEEGKEKIIKKIKESFDKNNITIDESIFNSMIPKGKKNCP
jgi:hypothetical protein